MNIALIVYVIVALAEVLAEATDNTLLRYVTKPLLMPVLITYFYLAVRHSFNSMHKLLLVAFVFSWFGDVFLMFVHHNELFFLAGLGSFLTTHVLYVLVFNKVSFKDTPSILPSKFWILIPLIAYFGLLMASFFSKVPADMQIPVAIYSATIALMVVFAINRYNRVNEKSFSLVLAGALLFTFSDSLIALNKFLFDGNMPLAGVGIMVLYISAQYLIAQGASKQ